VNTTETGRSAVQKYHQEARSLNRTLPVSFTDFEDLIRRTYFPKSQFEAPKDYTGLFYPKSDPATLLNNFYDGIGVAIQAIGKTEASVQYSMKTLAQAGGGGIPVNRNAFFSALRSEPILSAFLSAASYVITESAKDVGEGVIALGSGLNKYKYVIAVAALGAAALWLRNLIPGMKHR
jgi:hypothetical protein